MLSDGTVVKMGLLARLRARRGSTAGPPDLHVADPRFDGWETVRDFEDLDSARAWSQHLEERGIEAALTADWPVDRFGRGDIALQVPPGRWSEAEEALGGFDF